MRVRVANKRITKKAPHNPQADVLQIARKPSDSICTLHERFDPRCKGRNGEATHAVLKIQFAEETKAIYRAANTETAGLLRLGMILAYRFIGKSVGADSGIAEVWWIKQKQNGSRI
jgi:hypothetical protein